MTKNVGSADRVIRVIIAAIVAGLYFMGVISGTVAIVLLALAAIFIVTSFLSFCPIYWAIGMSTASKNKQ